MQKRKQNKNFWEKTKRIVVQWVLFFHARSSNKKKKLCLIFNNEKKDEMKLRARFFTLFCCIFCAPLLLYYALEPSFRGNVAFLSACSATCDVHPLEALLHQLSAAQPHNRSSGDSNSVLDARHSDTRNRYAPSLWRSIFQAYADYHRCASKCPTRSDRFLVLDATDGEKNFFFIFYFFFLF